MEFDLLTAAVSACIGIGVGLALSKLFFSSGDSSQIKQQFADLKREQQDYQSKVNEHFIRTTQLIESLNNNYQEIQVHLLQGAEQLVSPDFQLAQDLSKSDRLEDASDNEHINHPKDWAPKAADQEGTLSEGFGLRVEDLKQTQEPK